ncbi:unnamed protein product, partial [Polarella glacialis]
MAKLGKSQVDPEMKKSKALTRAAAPSKSLKQFFGGDAAGAATVIAKKGQAFMADWSPRSLSENDIGSLPSTAASTPSQQPPGESPSRQQPHPEDEEVDECCAPVKKKLKTEVNTELEGMSKAGMSLLEPDLMGMIGVASAADM